MSKIESQYLFERGVDATLTQRFDQELKGVNRALEKIEEGTYGLSDLSGEPIPRGRLEAIPEALYTIEEQQRREEERRPQSNLSGRYNRGVDRYSYRGEDEARDPIFRSDLEERPEPPRYEPLRPGGGLWSVVKRLLAPLVAVGLLLAKFKWILLALLKVKFIGTALTMLLSVGAYALLFPVWFAVGFVVLIWIHEMGHVLQLIAACTVVDPM